MSDDGRWEPNEGDHAERASMFTFATGSTVWGPGALTGKFLKTVGEIGLDMIVEAIIRRRLSVIKRTLKKRPVVFLELGSQDAEQSQAILRDLEELCREYYSGSVRATATILQAEIQVYQEVPVVRRALANKNRIFTNPRNEEEKQLANETFEALKELVDERFDYLGIAARRLVRSIASLYLERETVEAIRWKALSRDIQDFEPIDVMVTEETTSASMDDVKIGNASALRNSDLKLKASTQDGQEVESTPPAYCIMVTTEKTIANMDDIKIGQFSGLRDPDIRARSIVIEENMMGQYLEPTTRLFSF